MKPRSFRPRSTAAQTMWTSGYARVDAARSPPGAATRQTSVTERAPASLTCRDRGDARVAGREHRVEDDRVALLEVVGELHVVLDRLERLLVAVHAHEPDARARDQRERALEHPDAGAEDRADGDLLPGDPLRLHRLERGLDLDGLGREVLRRLVGEEQRDLVDELAEVDGRRVLVAQVGELVLDERVVTTVSRGLTSCLVGRPAAEARVERPLLAERRGSAPPARRCPGRRRARRR